jgi:Glyoxalase-like domain
MWQDRGVVTGRIHNVTFDCHRPKELVRFWSEVLGYTIQEAEENWASAVDPAGRGPRLLFRSSPKARWPRTACIWMLGSKIEVPRWNGSSDWGAGGCATSRRAGRPGQSCRTPRATSSASSRPTRRIEGNHAAERKGGERMRFVYLVVTGAADPTRLSIALHLAANGSLEVGHEVSVLFAGDGTEILLGDNVERLEGVGVEPVRELMAKLKDRASIYI